MEDDWIKSLEKNIDSYNDSRWNISLIMPLIQELFDSGINPRNFSVCCSEIAVQCNISITEVKKFVGIVLDEIGSLY
jgi:hypothetical protein